MKPADLALNMVVDSLTVAKQLKVFSILKVSHVDSLTISMCI
jgi:hypothetical protein